MSLLLESNPSFISISYCLLFVFRLFNDKFPDVGLLHKAEGMLPHELSRQGLLCQL